MVTEALIKRLVRSLECANWNGILSALVLHGAQGAHSELATEGASWGEVPAKVVWALIKAVSVHWESGSAPVASVNWNGCY